MPDAIDQRNENKQSHTTWQNRLLWKQYRNTELKWKQSKKNRLSGPFIQSEIYKPFLQFHIKHRLPTKQQKP